MTTPTALRELIARIATDAEFARILDSEPHRVAAEYGLTGDDLAVLTSMKIDRERAAPRKLEERLSRSALFFGSEMHAASHDSGDSGGGADALHDGAAAFSRYGPTDHDGGRAHPAGVPAHGADRTDRARPAARRVTTDHPIPPPDDQRARFRRFTMSSATLRDLITRVAADGEFAERVRSRPDTVAEEFGLDASEVATLTTLRLDPATPRPRRPLHDELVGLGFTGSYPSLTAAIRAHGLRPHCEPCQASKGRDSSIISHPPGEETQWDWVELPNPPSSWGLGREAHLLVGSLSHSGRWRAVLADCEDFRT